MDNELFNKESVPKLYRKMAIPVVFAMVVTLVYNLTDTYFVAATNNTNLVAGVSLGAPVFTFLMALGNIFGQGGASLLSRLLGQNEAEGVYKVSSWCFYMSLSVGIGVAVMMLLLKEPMLSVLGASEETYQYAKDYYTWIVLGAPFVVCSFVHTNLLRTEGMAKESMIATIGGSLVNMILDPVFISVLGFGASGAAIASVMGYIFTVVFCLVIVKKKSLCLSVSRPSLKLSANHTKQILAIGLTAAVTNLMQSLGTIFLNQGLLPYGNDRIAAMGIAMKVSMIVLMIITGLTFGGQPLFGFYYGAGNEKKLRETIVHAVKLVGISGVLLSLAVFIAAPQLLAVFMKDEAVIQSGAVMLRLQVVTMVIVGFIMLATVLFQSMGKAVPALILAVSRQGIIFVIMILLLSKFVGYYGVLASQAVSDVITMVIAGILLCMMKNNCKPK